MRLFAICLCALVAAVAHGGDAVSATVAASIADAADRGDDFATLLPSLDDGGRIEALIQIGGRRIAAAAHAAASCLDSTNVEVRLAALRAVSALPAAPDIEARTRAALHDVDPRVRRAAIVCAVALDDRAAVGDIADALGDPDSTEAAHAALVRLAGGTDLGRQADDWKRWQADRQAKLDDAVARLQQQLESTDKSVVLGALPNVAMLDLPADQKQRLLEPLQQDTDPTIAAAASSVLNTVTGQMPTADAVGDETVTSSPTAAPVQPGPAAADVVATPRPLARGDLVLFAACGTAILVGVGLFAFLVRSGRAITKRFTRVISVHLRKKGSAKSEPSSALQGSTKAESGRTATSVRTEAVKPKSDRTAAISGERSGAAKVITDRVPAAQPGGERSGAAKVISDRVPAAKPASERSGAAKVISDRIEAAKASSDRTAAVKTVSERVAAAKSADAAKPTSERVPAVPTSPSKP